MARRDPVETFLSRAEAEAARYGASPLVFVRELIQNARDSGASRVELRASGEAGVERLVCRDDGEGMAFADARRFLFTLYASSKVASGDQVGRFGVGFWSVLRFEPSSIVIRSRPAVGEGWEVRLDGTLRRVERFGYAGPQGTEVVLERPARSTDLAEQVEAAARADARFVTRRDDPQRPLTTTVNGRRVNERFGLPPPSLGVRRKGLRCVVGLGAEPRVELLSHGLRVRSAAVLDDLLSLGGLDRENGVREEQGRDRSLGIEGLMPQVLVDSDRLQVMLARGDAREDRELRRAVSLARRELARLLRHQLDRSAPLSWPRRMLVRARTLLGGDHETRAGAWARRLVAPVGSALAVSVLLLAVVLSGLAPAPDVLRGRLGSPSEPVTDPRDPRRGASRPYTDPAGAYEGPTVSALGHPPATVRLSYSPPGRELSLVAFRVLGLDLRGRPVMAEAEPVQPAPRTGHCGPGCVEIVLDALSEGDWLRVPVPSGHAVDPTSMEVDGRPSRPFLTSAGETVVEVGAGRRARVRYRSGPAVGGQPPQSRWPEPPPPVLERLGAIEDLPEAERVSASTALVADLVRYDAGRRAASLFAERSGPGALARAVAVGAGDCDVQNSLLAAVLSHLGIPAHLAVGYIGRGGGVEPWMHAWVELVAEDGGWAVADASKAWPPVRPEPVLSTRGVPVSLVGEEEQGEVEDIAAQGSRAEQQTTSGAAVTRPVGWLGVVAAAGLIAAAVAVGEVHRRRRRKQRQVRLGPGADIADLLQGMLRQPAAFLGVAGIGLRPLVPLLDRRRASLERCRRLAIRSRLLSSSGGSRLAHKASAAGAPVVDARGAEGRVVAETLALPDLDLWERHLADAADPPAAELLGAALARHIGTVDIRVVPGIGRQLITLDLGIARLGRRRGWMVLVERESEMARAAFALARTRPARAAFLVADLVAGELTRELGIPARSVARLLADLAAQSLAEEGEAGS